MAMKDKLVTWFIQKVIIPRQEIIDKPGFIITQFSDKGRNVFLRELFLPESLIANLEKKIVKKYGLRGKKALYSAGKMFGCSYAARSFFPQKTSVSRKEFENYLHLASTYTHKPSTQLIICYGLSGSGKTTASQLLLETIPGIRIRSDVERKRIQGIPPEKTSASGIDNGLYSADMSQQTYQRLYELARLIIESGYTVIVDATFLKQQQRQLFQVLAQEKEVPYRIVHCHANYETMCQRIINRQQSEQDASEADLNVLDQQIQRQQCLTQDELGFCIDLDTNSGINPEQVSCLLQI